MLHLDKPRWSWLITSMSLIITDVASFHSKSVILENGYDFRKQTKNSSKGSRKPTAAAATKSVQLCPTLCDP